MKIPLTILSFLITSFLFAQNLVPNPSFENYTNCPTGFGQIYYAYPWFQPCTYSGNTTNSSNSELFNTCSSSSNVDIPSNTFGTQNARTGYGYAGIWADNGTANILEYLEVPLISTLIAGKTYCVEFYVSLSDNSTRAISNIGAYFSIDSLLTNAYYPAIGTVTPQVENSDSNMLNDKDKWMRVSGNFVAVGDEKYMTIGKFRIAANTNGQNVSGGTFLNLGGYYYIDDVSIIDCDSIVSIDNEYIKINLLNLYPNPAKDELTIEYDLKNNCDFELYDLIEAKRKTVWLDSGTLTKRIDLTDIDSGLYFYSVVDRNGNRIKTGKLIVIK